MINETVPKLLTALQSVCPDENADAEAVADWLWLAAHSIPSKKGPHDESSPRKSDSLDPEQVDQSDSGQQPESEATNKTSDSDHLEDTTSHSEGDPKPNQSDNLQKSSTPLYSGGQGTGTGSGLPLRVPGGRALPHSLALVRALRPLKQQIETNDSWVIDEEATVRRIADTGIWTPVLKANRQRWLELALVLDESPSMRLWHNTIKELRALLVQLGAFRDIRIWRLKTSGKDQRVDLHSGAGEAPCHFRGLVNTARPRLIVIVSDFISPAWQGEELIEWLNVWGREHPVNFIQLLPQRLWRQSRLRTARLLKVTNPASETPNSRFHVHQPALPWAEPATEKAIPFPLISLEPDLLADWAHFIVGNKKIELPAFQLQSREQTSVELPKNQSEENERLQQFRAVATPTAYKLACFLAAAPLMLPVMRLVQRVLVPESGQSHLAEFFLSGLIKRVNTDEEIIDPDKIVYDFLSDNLRNTLLESGLITDAVRVQEEISRFINEHYNDAFSFQAIIRDPKSTGDVRVSEELRPFAKVTGSVLEQLGGKYTKAAQEIRIVKAAGIVPLKPLLGSIFYLPQAPTRFTGRIPELNQLADLLLRSEEEKTVAIVGITGQGGIGKSALAFHFAKEYRDKFPDGIIAERVNGKDADTIARIFARIGGKMIAEDDVRPGVAIMQEAFAHRRMLLIFDNAETADILTLHPGGKCAVIITTRDRDLLGRIDVPKEQCVDLPVLPDQDAWNLLACSVDRSRLEDEAEAVARILELVGNLPLAVEIVGKTLQKRLRRNSSFSLTAYAEALDLERLSLPRDVHLNVRICFNQSIWLLEDDGRDDLISAFARLSVCQQNGFSLHTAMAVLETEDEYATEENMFELLDLSFLSQQDTGRFIYHPLMYEFAKEIAKERNLVAVARQNHTSYFIDLLENRKVEELVAELDDILLVAKRMAESGDDSYINFSLNLKKLLTHLSNWFQLARLYIQQAEFNILQGELHNAEETLLAAQDIVRKIEPLRGQQHTDVVRLNTLGRVYQLLGKFDHAVRVFLQSRKITEQLEDERGLAMVLNSLGGVYQRQGKFDDAMQSFRQSLKIEEELDNQRGQAMVLNSLGGVYQRQGIFDGAVQAFQQSCDISERLGDERSLAMVLNSLGGVYQRQGKFDDAMQSFRQSLKIEEELDNQRGQAMVLNSLGGVYQRQGIFDGAVQAFQQSCDISERLGDERSLAMVLNSLGGVYQRQGKFDDAVQSFRQSYAISEQLEDERSLAMVLNSLGGVYQRQGKFDDAVQSFRQGYDISERLEDEHSMSMILNSLGGIYQRQKMFDDAIQAFRQSFNIAVQMKDERCQAISLNSLGGVYQRQGKFKETVEVFWQSYEIFSLLEDKRGVAMVSNSLGEVYQRQGKLDNAVQAFQESAAIGKKIDDKRLLAMVLNSLGGIYQRQGEFDDAVRAFQESYDIGQVLGDERHLAIVTSSWGRVLLSQNKPEEALVLLEQCFAIDEKIKNRRGLGMVTPLLCHTLRRLRRTSEAAAFCRRALKITPKNNRLLVLQKSLEECLLLTGTVKFIRPSRDGDHYFGYITMDDGGNDVRFDSHFVDISGLDTGTRVAVEVNINRESVRVAQKVEIINEQPQAQ